MFRVLVLLSVVLLPGCAAVAALGGGVEGVSVMATEKTMTDHIVSMASGKDCSTLRKEQGLTYCKEDEVVPKMNVYCYRTLGEVNCYEQPIYDGRQERVRQDSEKAK